MSSIADFYRRKEGVEETPSPDPTPLPPDGEVHDAGAFRMRLPAGWADQTMHLFTGPIEAGVQHTVTAVVDRGVKDDLAAYADMQVKALQATLKSCSILRREDITLVCGIPAVRVVTEWRAVEGQTLVQELVCVVKDDRGYRLVATYTPATFESLGPAVRGMLLGFTPS